MKKQNLRALKNLLREVGVESSWHDGVHYQLSMVYQDRKAGLITISKTPSDRSVCKKIVGDIKRELKAIGFDTSLLSIPLGKVEAFPSGDALSVLLPGLAAISDTLKDTSERVWFWYQVEALISDNVGDAELGRE